MSNQKLIDRIDSLYPIDCEYSNTNQIGKQLLFTAIEKVGWRKLPDEFLAQYLIECANEEESGEVTALMKLHRLI